MAPARRVADLEAALAERDAVLAERDAALAERDAVLAERDAALAGLEAAIAERDAAIEALCAEHAGTVKVLMERIGELECRLGLNSTNSSKPPSSDGLRKPNADESGSKKPSRAGAAKRKPGGQPGRVGKTLRPRDDPDRIENHYPSRCGLCGGDLERERSVSYAARQVFDIPPPPPLEVVEHRAHACACAACGEISRAGFPEGVNAPVQYGSRISSLVLYFNSLQMLPRKRLAEMMGDVFKVAISQGAVSAIVRRGGKAWAPFADRVRDAIARAQVKHLDETGARVEGRLKWLHVACTELLCHFRLGESRGDVMADATGIAVHDFWKPYFAIRALLHALCIAHILRELEQRVEFDGEAWAGRMGVLLQSAVHEINVAEREGKPFPYDLAGRVGPEYDDIVAAGIVYHDSLPPLDSPGKRGRRRRRKGHNLAVRMRDYKQEVLRFARDPSVPATNNLAERLLRLYKIQQKISGCYRSVAGAVAQANLRTMLETARMQGWNVLETIEAGPAAASTKLKTS